MESIYNSFSDVIPGVPGSLLFWLLIGAIVVVLGITLGKSTLGSDSSTRKVSKALKKLGTEMVSNVMIADYVEGPIHIEHLCLTPTGIAVVDIKDYRGYLFGGANTDQWTQVIDNRSYRFENPLHRNKDRIRAIESLVDEIPIYGCVVFTNAGSFPKDKPDGVFMQENINDGLGVASLSSSAPNSGFDVPTPYVSEWQELLERLKPSSELTA